MDQSNSKSFISQRNLRFLSFAVLALGVAFAAISAAGANLHLPGVVNVPNSLSVGTNSDPASTAVVDFVSTTKGMLQPRMTTTQMNAVSSPAEGLSIYNTSSHAPQFYNGSAWTPYGAGSVTSISMTVPTFLSVSGSPITSSGTLAVTLSGTALPVANGGSGQVSLTAHDVLIGNGTSGVGVAAPTSTANALVSNGTSSDPTFQTLGIAGGGTGQTTLTSHGMLIGAGTSAITQLAAPATGTVLEGQGTSADPAFTAAPTSTTHGLNTGSSGGIVSNSSGTLYIGGDANSTGLILGSATTTKIGVRMNAPQAAIHFGSINGNSNTTSGTIGTYAVILGGLDSTHNVGEGAFIAGGTGGNNYASGQDGIAIGYNDFSSGIGAIAAGYANNASGDYSSSFGAAAHAAADGSLTLGYGAQTTAGGTGNTHNVAIGDTALATGGHAVAAGWHTTAQGFGQVAVGAYNIVSGTGNSRISTDEALIVGNGTSGATSNAFSVSNDGKTKFWGTTSGHLDFLPAAATTTYTLNWPAAQGGGALTNDGSGNLSWASNLSNPMSNQGDVIVGAGSGSPAAVAKGSSGQYLGDDSTATNLKSNQEIFNDYNFLVNSGMDYFQESTSKTVTATGGGTPTAAYIYGADQWYVKNILGGGTIEGIITTSKQPFSVNGSANALRAIVTTAPTGTGIQNGLEIYQPLSALASIPLYNKTASFSVQVLGDNHVNQVGIQFYYATSEGKLTTAIGSETTCTVNNSTFTLCAINGQALGVAWAPAGTGIVGVRIRPTAVSTGNLYDLNNGLDIEQGMLNLGPVAHTWHRQFSNPAMELSAAQYFYRKTFPITTAPAQNTGSSVGALNFDGQVANVGTVAPWGFAPCMRGTPTITTYSTNATNANWGLNGNTPVASASNTGACGTFIGASSPITAGAGYSIHATADARM